MRKASNAVVERQKQRLAAIKGPSNSDPKGMLKASEIHMVLHSDEDKNKLLKFLEQIELEHPIDVVIKKATKSRNTGKWHSAIKSRFNWSCSNGGRYV